MDCEWWQPRIGPGQRVISQRVADRAVVFGVSSTARMHRSCPRPNAWPLELARTLPEAYNGDELDVDYDELDRRMESIRDRSAMLVPWEEARKQLLGG
jgi:hypothetical protein